MEKIVLTKSSEETIELGKKIASILFGGSTILLQGDLGAGKTTFVRGIAEGLNIPDVVQSPTFNIMKVYTKGIKPLVHIDAYRLEDIKTDIGLDEYIGYETGITVIEWPQFIENLLPKDSIKVFIKRIDETCRDFSFIDLPKEVEEVL